MTNTVEIRVAVDAASGQARIRDFRRTMDGLGKTGVRAGAQLGRGFGEAREGIRSVGQQLARAKQQLLGFVSAAAAIQLGRNVAATASVILFMRFSSRSDGTHPAVATPPRSSLTPRRVANAVPSWHIAQSVAVPEAPP